MLQHLPNPDPAIVPQTIWVTNPGYISPEKLKQYHKDEAAGLLFGTVEEILEDAKAVWGDHTTPTMPRHLDAEAYCGVKLERVPQPAPLFFWDCINYIRPWRILDYPEDEICWKCVAHLDKIRAEQGHRSVIEHLKNPDSCDCSMQVLQRRGCICGVC